MPCQCRSPLALSRVAARNVLFRTEVLLRGLVAHVMAEAMFSAPQVLGSLQLLMNPTGLVQSVQRGVADLINMPLAGWNQGSPLQFISGMGRGSASLVKHISGRSEQVPLFFCCPTVLSRSSAPCARRLDAHIHWWILGRFSAGFGRLKPSGAHGRSAAQRSP